jgi:hypothetical protein
MGMGRMVERAGEAAGLPFPVHVHMLRHSTGYALAARGMDTRRLQHFLGHASITNTVRYTAMSLEPFKDIWRDVNAGFLRAAALAWSCSGSSLGRCPGNRAALSCQHIGQGNKGECRRTEGR